MDTAFTLRRATRDDVPALQALIPLSVRVLQAEQYSAAQIEAALGYIFAVDSRLIRDNTYFVVTFNQQIVGCGGWSRYASTFGGDDSEDSANGDSEDSANGDSTDSANGDSTDSANGDSTDSANGDDSIEPDKLDPAHDPARIRAFFVHPDFVRRGIGRAILAASESAAADAGFTQALLVATLSGEPLYSAMGYMPMERFESPLPGGLRLPVVRMGKLLGKHGAAKAVE